VIKRRLRLRHATAKRRTAVEACGNSDSGEDIEQPPSIDFYQLDCEAVRGLCHSRREGKQVLNSLRFDRGNPIPPVRTRAET
jgi:hypothetical protein